MMRDFLRTLFFITDLGVPSAMVFFLMGMAAGGYAQIIGRLFADFIEAVWERLYKVV